MARKRTGVMLAYSYDEHRVEKWLKLGDGIFVQPKLEGDRCRARIDAEGRITLFSSSAKEITVMEHIVEELSHAGFRDIELDGELFKLGMPHEEIRSRLAPVYPHPKRHELEYHVYDIVHGQLLQDTRLEIIHELIQGLKTIKPVFSQRVDGFDDIELYYDKFLGEGYEGIIFRRPDALYRPVKSTDLMKLKPRLSNVYPILGAEEEYDVYGHAKNALGALVLCTEDGIDFNVGTGFTREQREQLWAIRDTLPGKFAKIRYQAVAARGRPKMASFVEIVEILETR